MGDAVCAYELGTPCCVFFRVEEGRNLGRGRSSSFLVTEI